ncbi:hypothetical protein [Aquimarina longa]|uniref:hypothetical protein n=1 Tax=Aquimarina longa TaxID=1080221 RepID=UPI0007842C63|nr:hypothetical protein [Aquimarina longa]
MKLNRQILASIFLIFFGIIQLADIHIVGHDTDDEDCSLCEFTLNHHNDDFTPVDTLTISKVIQIPIDVVRTTYIKQYFGSSVTYSFLNKAPPTA